VTPSSRRRRPWRGVKGDLARQALEVAPGAGAELDETVARNEPEDSELPTPPAATVGEPGLVTRTRPDTSQFAIQHGEQEEGLREDGKRACKREPFRPGMTNDFVPDDELAPGEKKSTEWINAHVRPSSRRPASKVPDWVEVTCPKCKTKHRVDPFEAGQQAGGDRMVNVCMTCMKEVIPARG
jgi:hypothetical protein